MNIELLIRISYICVNFGIEKFGKVHTYTECGILIFCFYFGHLLHNDNTDINRFEDQRLLDKSKLDYRRKCNSEGQRVDNLIGTNGGGQKFYEKGAGHCNFVFQSCKEQ